jgi:bifunctional oligoribonuclease and PAP phosphatase NrnA
LENNVQQGIQQLASYLEQKRKVLIITHYNPDGDAIGSSMGLYHFLKKCGHDVTVMTPNEFPSFLGWMEETKNIIIFQNNKKKAIETANNAELIICVDFNDFKRLKDLGPILSSSPAIKALIDHHPQPENGFTYSIHDTAAAATAELIFKFIKGTGKFHLVDKTVSECIYTGIMTDTGCFSYNSSNPATFQSVAELLGTGFNKDEVFDNVYNNFSHNRMKLMGYCLNEKMVVLPQFQTAYIWLTKEEQEKYNFQPGDSEGFVNLPFSIKGVNITALFTEKKDNIRISFRSRGSFMINEFCQKHFEGGGHKNAAGGESKLPMKETLEKFEKLIEIFYNESTEIK